MYPVLNIFKNLIDTLDIRETSKNRYKVRLQKLVEYTRRDVDWIITNCKKTMSALDRNGVTEVHIRKKFINSIMILFKYTKGLEESKPKAYGRWCKCADEIHREVEIHYVTLEEKPDVNVTNTPTISSRMAHFDDVMNKLDLMDKASMEWKLLDKLQKNEELKFNDFCNNKGNAFKNQATFAAAANKALKILFNSDEISISTVKKLFKPVVLEKRTPQFCDDIDELLECNFSKFQYDEKFDIFIKGLKVYADSGHEGYPYILIEISPYKKYEKYSLYRYFAQLPNFVSLSANAKLPTVDHISRVPSDSRLENLRYCTQVQNANNKCRVNNTSAKYHGMGKDGFIGIACSNENLKVHTMVWCSILDAYLSKHTVLPKQSYNHLSFTSCRAKYFDEYKHHACFMDDFVSEMLKFDMYHAYTKEMDKEDIMCPEHPFLKEIYNAFPSNEKVYKTRMTHDYVIGLLYDIIKYKENGSFAHMNLIKPAQVVTTVSVPHIYSPVEILNMFEQERDQEVLNKYYNNMMITTEDNKIRRYSQVNGRIISEFTDRDISYTSILNEVVETPQIIIVSPFTSYKKSPVVN